MKTIIFSIIALVVSAACESMPPEMDMADGINLDDCSTVTIPDNCKVNKGGKAKSAKVTFHTQGNVTVTPPFVCGEKGGTLEVHIVPRPAANKKGTVAVIPKNLKSIWLAAANNSDDKKIEIPIPADLADDDYSYAVYMSNDKCVDPRIHVR